MKRFFQILGILLLLLVAAMFFLPIIFKDEIIARARAEMNKNLTATIDFRDIDISLFRSFPDFTLTIHELTVDGQGEFEGVRLAGMESLQLDLGLFSVISGDRFEIESVEIEGAEVHLLISEDGAVNYDIVKADSAAAGNKDSATSSNFKLSLNNYILRGSSFIYEDRAAEIKVLARDFVHSGTGDFTQEVFTLDTETDIKSFTLMSGDMPFLEEVQINGDMLFEFNQPAFKLTFLENNMSLNELALTFSGFIAVPTDDISMKLSFNSPNSDFKHILSLLPSVYSKDFAGVKTSGEFSLNGEIDGVYNYEREVYPSFDFKLDIRNGTFQYPNLPASVTAINLQSHIFNPSDNLDATVIDIPAASANIGGSPLTARLQLSTPMSDPAIDAYMKTDFQLENLGRVVPADGFDYRGHIAGEVEIAARMSDVDNENYEAIKASGQLMAENIIIKNDSLPHPVEIPQMQMNFTPQKVELSTFQARLGASDIAANGSIDNLLAYMLDDRLLKGSFNLNSALLDLNQMAEFSGEESAPSTNGQGTSAPADSSNMQLIRLPENIDFTLNASVQKLLYDNLEIANLQGLVSLQNGVASLQNLQMDMLGGSLALNGSYNSSVEQPVVDMNFKINDFSFAESFSKLNTMRSIAPIIESTTGSFSTGFTFNSKLRPDMSPDLSTILASGSLVTEKMVTSPKALSKLAGMLNNPDLSSLDIGKLNLSFKVEDGRVKVEPFNLNAGTISAVVSGSNGLDKTLDYTMLMKIPLSGIKAQNLLNKIGATKEGKAELAVKIGGTYDNPKVSTSLGDIFGNVVDNIKGRIEEVKQEAVDKLNTRAQELIDAAVAKGDQLIAVAREQADKLRGEAQKQADNLVKEADGRATKLEDEAKGNLLKEKGASLAADKIRSEARSKADNIIAAANKKANDLVNTAEQQKAKLVEEAREKAKVENP